MQHKTRGIVLHTMPYSDRFAIVRMFTEEFGPVSYLVPQSKSRTSKTPRSLFFPLAILDIEVVHHNLRDIHQLKEARLSLSLPSLYTHPVKNTICIFIAEFISKVIRDIQPDKLLFNFLVQSLKILELTDKGYANFHLVFAIRLTRFLGFYPDSGSYETGAFFDMQNGVFTHKMPLHNHFLYREESHGLSLLLRMNYENMHRFRLSGSQRTIIINKAVEYYRLHLAYFPELKSLEVLSEVFT